MMVNNNKIVSLLQSDNHAFFINIAVVGNRLNKIKADVTLLKRTWNIIWANMSRG